MASVVFDVRKAVAGLSKLEKGLGDLTPLFREISQQELSETLLRFKSEEDPEGNKWPDSKTIRRNAGGSEGGFSQQQAWNYVLKSNFHAVPPGWHWFDRARGDKVLTDTGTMRLSIGTAYGANYGIVGTNNEYAEKHQEGDGVAMRQFLGVSEMTESNVENALNLFLGGLLK